MKPLKQLFCVLSLAILPSIGLTAPLQHHTFNTSDGVRLHYIEGGRGEQAIVLIPGWLMPAAVFEKQFEVLARQYRVLALDPRSQGLSEVTKQSHAPKRRIQDIAEFLKAAKVNEFVLAGWSLGVLESLDYVAQYNPKGLRGLILIDNSVGEGRPPKGRRSNFAQTMNDPVKREQYMRTFSKDIYRKTPPPLLAQAVLDSALQAAPDVAIQLLNQPYPRTYWSETLQKQKVPVLYAVRPWLAEQADALKLKRAPELITVEMFDKAGHALFVDEPETFNQAVLKFSQQAFARKK
ncbi:alpha/beta hydrolase [Zwartia sp.]|uniref:alpha/beta fold hydrolase n=1 Tax=Zwartia sp. TaxID=2978004 RepID=UPI002718CC7C|nr:alpha/beta hydrolase [Zwartia sp.]MDO9024416.1 alpha/beta hydrolase [Zwartia sp.]